ncbi:GTP-dependent dephospho-CoA kinase family protein [Methanohalophilus profundi]|uniref:GTP-dependent dephospho-CoA kinase family protein n=1 Tax=Methanohalophilus profundi TaxID=2138083 RepID=UPI00101C5118|nr:GTP-dependent dephospho-CoA kinase family protein [Methanohalophilus profundi]
MGGTISIPASLRPLLRKKFGVLYKGSAEENIGKVSRDLDDPIKLISVGDVTTFHLLKSNIIPDILVIDDKTHRQPACEQMITGTKQSGFKELVVNNPAGSITEELVDALAEALDSNRRVRIFVQGEEDLASLPAIMMAPVGSVVLYGQPGEGMMFVRITASKKEEMTELIDKIIDQQHCKEQLYTMWRKLYGYQHN